MGLHNHGILLSWRCSVLTVGILRPDHFLRTLLLHLRADLLKCSLAAAGPAGAPLEVYDRASELFKESIRDA